MHTSYTFYHSLSITAILLLLLIILKKFNIINFSKKKVIISLISSVILVFISLIYTEVRNSGMGNLKTFGFPRFFIEYWSDFENKESHNSFRIQYFIENLVIYFLTILILLGIFKNRN